MSRCKPERKILNKSGREEMINSDNQNSMSAARGWASHVIKEASVIVFLWSLRSKLYLFQFSSVAQSCPTLCNPMNRSTPGLPVHHQLPEFTETHVHRVSDAIQPSHPLSSPSPSAPNPSQHQNLFQWVRDAKCQKGESTQVKSYQKGKKKKNYNCSKSFHQWSEWTKKVQGKLFCLWKEGELKYQEKIQ